MYGLLQLAQKSVFLEEIHNIKEWVGMEHWIIGGDFNLIRSLEEKKGAVRTISNISASFNKLIEELQLVDVRTTNRLFTWQNNRSEARHITSRLDRFLVLESTLIGEREIEATVLPAIGSDHWTICLEWGQLGEFVKRPFRFENFLFQHSDFQRLVKEWWTCYKGVEGPCMYVFQQNLKYIKERLKTWNRESFGNITLEKHKLEQQLEDIQTRTM